MYLIIASYLTLICLFLFIQPALSMLVSACLITALIALGFYSVRYYLKLRHATNQLRSILDNLEHKQSKSSTKLNLLEQLREIAQDARTFVDRFSRRERKSAQELNLHRVILESMVEVVIVVDQRQRILEINQAGLEWLGLQNQSKLQHSSIEEAISNAELQRFIHRSIVSKFPIEQELVLYGEPERIVHAYGRNLTDNLARVRGSLIVLNDITHLKRLENIRKDFVANVSHELKTPITSIKGFVETLIDGAVDNKEDRQRFLEIIARQADRLGTIIEDLLSLSRIEQGNERSEIELNQVDLNIVIRQAIENCRHAALQKKVQISWENPQNIIMPLNASLIEQALVNLINNAIKYSSNDAKVVIGSEISEHEVSVKVKDFGCGIDKLALPRIFERFYRVDKARSRKEGGTGLGLAIVKHIIQAHNGRVSVESTPGLGSTFTVHLPRSVNQLAQIAK